MRSQEGARLAAVATIAAVFVCIDAVSIRAQDPTTSPSQPAVAAQPGPVASPLPGSGAAAPAQACPTPSGSFQPVPLFGGFGVFADGQEFRTAVLPYNVAQQSLLNKIPSPIPNYEHVFDRQRAA